jgi:uncharacterized membrane protein YhaH (DUF805 family)
MTISQTSLPKKRAVKPTKEKVQKVSEKKVASIPSITPDLLIKVWFDGWKKMFTLKGRSSLLELWTFLLFNTVLMLIVQMHCSYILSDSFLRSATLAGYSLNKIDTYVLWAQILFYIVLLVPLIPLLSLMVRRMHDLSKLAWKKYLEPLCMGATTLFILHLTLDDIENTSYVNLAMVLMVVYIATLYAVLFYGLKFVFTTMFFAGVEKDNDFGKKPLYNTEEHNALALNFTCLYTLIVLTISLLYIVMAILPEA